MAKRTTMARSVETTTVVAVDVAATVVETRAVTLLVLQLLLLLRRKDRRLLLLPHQQQPPRPHPQPRLECQLELCFENNIKSFGQSFLLTRTCIAYEY